MQKQVLFSALLISFSSYASSIEGTYQCKGNEIGTHDAFTCEMVIKQSGATYASTATCSDGNSYRGTGIYDEKTQQLSTGFTNPKKPEETGVCVATFKNPNELASTWTYLDKTSVAYTTCSKK